MNTKIKWLLLIISLALIFGKFGDMVEDTESFVPMDLQEFQLSPAAKVAVLSTQPETAAGPDIYQIMGIALLAIVIFSKNK